jgi:hypothetical protein
MHIPRLLGKSIYIERYLSSQINPSHVQKFLLAKILIQNRNTKYGKEYDFKKIRTIKDFQKQIPITTYEDYVPYIEEIKEGKQKILTTKKVKFFATTSGTTSEPKYIPITKTRINQFREEFAIWSFHVLKRFPKLTKGKTLYFAANSSNGFTKGGIEHGNISGYVTKNTPKIVKRRLVIPEKLMDEIDFEKLPNAFILKTTNGSSLKLVVISLILSQVILFNRRIPGADRILKRQTLLFTTFIIELALIAPKNCAFSFKIEFLFKVIS